MIRSQILQVANLMIRSQIPCELDDKITSSSVDAVVFDDKITNPAVGEADDKITDPDSLHLKPADDKITVGVSAIGNRRNESISSSDGSLVGDADDKITDPDNSLMQADEKITASATVVTKGEIESIPTKELFEPNEEIVDA